MGSVELAQCIATVVLNPAWYHNLAHSGMLVATNAGTSSMTAVEKPQAHATRGMSARGRLRGSCHCMTRLAADHPWQGRPAINMWAGVAILARADRSVISCTAIGLPW